MRKALAIGTALATFAGMAALAAPASAQTAVDFTLTGSGLTIAPPTATATLVSGSIASLVGTTVTGSIGSTTVSDERGGLTGWSATIAGTAFSNTTTTIPVGSVKAFVPGAITITGTAAPTAGTYLTEATALPLTGVAQNFVTTATTVGVNTATFAPSLSVAVPSNATAGKYSGTITQTVS